MVRTDRRAQQVYRRSVISYLALAALLLGGYLIAAGLGA